MVISVVHEYAITRRESSGVFLQAAYWLCSVMAQDRSCGGADALKEGKARMPHRMSKKEGEKGRKYVSKRIGCFEAR